MGVARHDLYFSASVFLVPPTEISRYSARNTHLKFYYFGTNLFAHYLRLSKLVKIPIQMVWYYDVLSEAEKAWGAGSHLPHCAVSAWERAAVSLGCSSVVIGDGGAYGQTRILKLEY